MPKKKAPKKATPKKMLLRVRVVPVEKVLAILPHVEDRERWMELAERASTEQDGKKLAALIKEITELLAAKQKRIDSLRAPKMDPGISV